jgi:hypothetical protein
VIRAGQRGNVEILHALLKARVDLNAQDNVSAQLSNLPVKLCQSKP